MLTLTQRHQNASALTSILEISPPPTTETATVDQRDSFALILPVSLTKREADVSPCDTKANDERHLHLDVKPSICGWQMQVSSTLSTAGERCYQFGESPVDNVKKGVDIR